MDKKIFVILLLGILLLGCIEAKIKTYDSDKQEVAIKSSVLGVPTRDIAKIKLNTPLIYEVPIGYQKVAEFNITSYKDYNDALEKVDFYNIKDNMKKTDRAFDYKIKSYELVDINDYTEVCSKKVNSTQICKSVISGTHKELKETWTPLNKKDFKEGEVLTIGIFTEVLKGDKIEWIPTYYGVRIDEFASWSESLYTGLVAYYTMDYPSGNLIDSLGNYNLTKQSNPVYNQTGVVNKAIKIGQYSGFFTGDITGVNQDTNTIVVWFKKNEAGTGAILFGNSYYPANQAGMRVSYDNTNVICQVNDATYGPAAVSPLPPDTNFHQVVCIYNGTTMHQYIDGEFTANSTWDGRSLKEAGNTVVIGSDISGFISSGNSSLDEISIYNRPLTISEITELYNAGYGCSYSSCVDFGVTLNINSPIADYNSSSSNVEFNISAVTFFPHILVENVSLYIDDVLNETNTSHYNGTYIFNKILSEGNHTWKIIAFTNTSLESISETRTFTIDLTNPTINITYPLNTTYFVNWANITQLNVSFNWTSHDVNLHSCWYSKNGGTNTSLVCNSNLTTNATYGTPINILACANDSVNNIGCSSRTVTFKYNLFYNKTIYNSTAVQTSDEYFTLVLQKDTNITSYSAKFYYNNKEYNSATYVSGNNINFTNVVYIPVSYSGNKSFYWSINFTNSTGSYVVNTSSNIQTITNLSMYSCSSENLNGITLNFTTYDSTNLTELNSTFEMNAYFRTLNTNGSEINSFLYSDLTKNNSNHMFCINASDNEIFINLYASYGATGYDNRQYIISNGTISQTIQNISLFLTETDLTDIVTVTVQDQDYNRLSNSLVIIQRWNVGTDTYSAIGMFTASSDGRGIIDLELYTTWYRAVVYYNGVLVEITDVQKLSSTNWIITVNLEVENPYDLFNGIIYDLSFNNLSNVTSFEFLDPTGYTREGCLVVKNYTNIGLVTIFNSCVTSVSGTIDYFIPSEGNYIVYGVIYLEAYSQYQIVDTLEITLGTSEIARTVSPFGKFISFLLLGTAGAIGVTSGSIVLGSILLVAVLFFIYKIGFLNITTGFIWGIVVVLLVISFLQNRRQA